MREHPLDELGRKHGRRSIRAVVAEVRLAPSGAEAGCDQHETRFNRHPELFDRKADVAHQVPKLRHRELKLPHRELELPHRDLELPKSKVSFRRFAGRA